MSSARFTTSYMDRAVFDLETVITDAVNELEPMSDAFDTLVGTGFSGSLVIPLLAMRLGKTFVLIRKETDDSHHGSGLPVGELGDRWIFVDDFCQSGKTKNRVISKICEAAEERGHVTTYIGNYYYQSWNEEKFEPEQPITSPSIDETIQKREEAFNAWMGNYPISQSAPRFVEFKVSRYPMQDVLDREDAEPMLADWPEAALRGVHR